MGGLSPLCLTPSQACDPNSPQQPWKSWAVSHRGWRRRKGRGRWQAIAVAAEGICHSNWTPVPSSPLFTLPEDQLPPGFPNIDMGPQLKVVERTRTATMLCAASGNPDPEITWFKDFLPVDPSASNGRIKQLRSGGHRWPTG